MGQFATGVTVVSYLADDAAAGMTANAFTSISMDPPLVLLSVRAESRFNRCVTEGTRYGINFLAESQLSLSAHFGGRPVAGLVPPFAFSDGTPLLEGSLAQLLVRPVDVHVAGDHVLYISQVERIKLGEQRKPLIFHGGKYRQVHAHAHAIGWPGTIDGW
jgi:flavin reductase (DIM6/NTAB) family NADH-FMN oxidoreductase RutF